MFRIKNGKNTSKAVGQLRGEYPYIILPLHIDAILS
jgi:hypothetical protein